MRILYTTMLLTLLALGSGQAAAECSCLCVDGALETVCTTAAEAGEGPALCAVHQNMVCPEAAPSGDAQTYDAPDADAENCRDAQIYDAASGDYVSAKVCDMASAE